MLPAIYLAFQFILLAAAQTTCPLPALSNTTTPSLNLTAIAGRGGKSVLECWQLPGFAASAGAGTVGALSLPLGSLSNATYTVLPARFNGGLHAAPYKQYYPLQALVLSSTILTYHFSDSSSSSQGWPT